MKMKRDLMVARIVAVLLFAVNIAAGASVTPVLVDPWISGNAAFECGQIGSTCPYAFKLDWTETGTMNGAYQQNDGNVITISNDNGISFDWASNYPVCAVIVKAGTKAYVYWYNNDYTSDTGLVAPEGKKISHATFCYSKAACTGTITGTKTTCNNAGVGGTTITLYESDGTTYVDDTTTGTDGTYTFPDLMPGTYKVCETVPEGMYSYDSTGKIVEAGYEVCMTVTVECGKTATANFVNYPLLTISGTKTACGEPVSGTTITLKDSTGTEVDTTTTGSDGTYSFKVLPGTYKVCETVPEGMYSYDSTGKIVKAGEEVCQEVTVADCDTAKTADFKNYPLLTISGKKTNAVNGAGMAGWTINLFKSTDLTTPIDSKTTGDDGSYTFDGLLPGDYRVCEELEDGWQAVTPTCVDVALTDCESNGGVTGIDFANRRCETAWGFPRGTTFVNSGIATDWGWYKVLYCGDLAGNGYTDDLIAAAGQNVVEKGTKVGTVNAKIDGNNLVLTYTMYPNYILTAIQAYASNTMMTGANPGGFAFKDETGGNVLTIPLSGNIGVGKKATPYTLDCTKGIYIAMHADVCWKGLEAE